MAMPAGPSSAASRSSGPTTDSPPAASAAAGKLQRAEPAPWTSTSGGPSPLTSQAIATFWEQISTAPTKEILAGLADVFESTAQEKGLVLCFDMPPELSGELSGDPLRLRQVLQNLVSNGLKYRKRKNWSLGLSDRSRAMNSYAFMMALRQ